MPVSPSKVRVVIFVPPEIADRCSMLAARHRASKSEVYRLAIETGLKDVRPALQRLARRRPAVYRAARGGGSRRPAVVSRSTPKGSASTDLYEQVLAYGKTFLSVTPGCCRDDARVVLEAQARVLGVPADLIDELVDEVLAELFSEAGPGGGGASDDGAVLPPD